MLINSKHLKSLRILAIGEVFCSLGENIEGDIGFQKTAKFLGGQGAN